MLEDYAIILFLILAKPACDSSLVPSSDTFTCGMDFISTSIARSTMPLF